MCEFCYNLPREFACTLQPSPGQFHKTQQCEMAETERHHSLWHQGFTHKGFIGIFSPILSLEEHSQHPA